MGVGGEGRTSQSQGARGWRRRRESASEKADSGTRPWLGRVKGGTGGMNTRVRERGGRKGNEGRAPGQFKVMAGAGPAPPQSGRVTRTDLQEQTG
eukprot:6074863-Amphidinium_carterae.1